MANTKALTAEFIGTFFLCFAGIAAILSNTPAVGAGMGIVGIALAHGLALSVAVSAFGGVSGAHFNPAVTIGMLSTRRIKLPAALSYIVVQLLGATVAALACKTIFPPEATMAANLGIPLPASWVTPTTLITCEAILTFLLMTAIYGTAVDERGKAVKIGGFGIGLTVTFDILAAGAVTGASMNPARSFGPALIQGDFQHHICYWIAPIIGAVLAAQVYEHVILDKK
jgi:MIP family channel proteins